MSPRYVPLVKIASGGMATVFVGALRGDLGFRRLVAIKRPHPHLAEDPDFRAALLEEAHVAARVRHAHVASVLDMEVAGDDVQLVMDYVEGATLSQLLAAASKRGEKLPPGVALRIAVDACAGLAAVHEARDEQGAPLGLVHRDVSPQNILVGLDGLARISDFGTAKSALEGRPSTTQGTLKGKLAYMAPEYVGRGRLDLRVDVFAMGVVLWESLAGKRLFRGSNDADTLDRVQREQAPKLSEVAPELGTVFDEVVARALVKEPEDRWPSVEALGTALGALTGEGALLSPHAGVARVVRAAVEPELEARRAEVRVRLAELEAAALPASTALPASSTPGAASVPLDATTRSAAPGEIERTSAVREVPRAGRRWVFVALPLGVLAAAGGVGLAWGPGAEPPAAASLAVAASAEGTSAAPAATAVPVTVVPAMPSGAATAPATATATATAANVPPGTAAPVPSRTSKVVASSASTSPPPTGASSGKRRAPPNPYAPR